MAKLFFGGQRSSIMRGGVYGGLTLLQRLRAIFSTGRNGAIYEPGDIATLYQDVGKTTPVTVVTDPVGSISDKSGVYGSGALTQITTAVAAGTNPRYVTVDPTGRFVYVSNYSTNTVGMYSINQTTGALTSIGAAVASGAGPLGITTDPTGKFVYVSNNTANTVSMYSINQTTGVLTSIGADVASGTNPIGVAVDPTGKFVYCSNNTAATVSMYSINQTTGALTSIAAAIAAGTNPYGVAADPTGRFAYVTNAGAATVSMYSINQTTGALTSIGAAVAAGAGPRGVAVDPTGRFVYVSNYTVNTVSMYSINQSTGALTSIGADVASGTTPYDVAVDPLGRFVYVSNYTVNTVSMYSINQTTGALTSIGAAVASGAGSAGVAADPLGRFIYVVGGASAAVSMYFIQRINYAIQATAAARPTWTNRVNLLTYTEQFDNAAWTKTGSCSVTPNTAVAPDGTVTADTVTIIDSFGVYQDPANVPVSTLCTWSIYVKGTPGETINVGVNAGTVSYQQVVLTASWQRISGQVLSTASGAGNYFHFRNDYPVPAGQVGTFVVDAWGAQLELGTTATRYQRVTTATDFDTAGFPYYLSFLGVDDSLTSATGGGGSAGFFWCGVVQPTGGTGTILWDDETGNNGYTVGIYTNQLTFYAGNGTGWTTKQSTATLSLGVKYLLTCWDDGVNLNVQINSAAAETVARPVVAAGTAGYSIGKVNGGASAFFIGNLYASVYFRDTAGTAADRAAAQAYCRAQGGL